jgi:hypothetical protein
MSDEVRHYDFPVPHVVQTLSNREHVVLFLFMFFSFKTVR